MTSGHTSSVGLHNEPQWQRWVVATVIAVVVGIAGSFVASANPLVAPDPVALKVQGPDTVGNLLPVQVQTPGATGSAATQLTSSATQANAVNNLSLTGTAGKSTYVTGFQVTGAGATAASVITVTITGTVTATQSYNIVIPAGVTTSITPLIVTFPTPIQSGAVGGTITLSVPAFGAGNTNSAAAIQGFIQ